MESDLSWWAIIVIFILLVAGVVAYHNHVESDCKAIGGHVKWFYGGKNSADNYLCLSQDGRIIG